MGLRFEPKMDRLLNRNAILQEAFVWLAFVYSWAGYERLEASYVKSSEKLKLKVRTLLVGSGVPAAFPRGGAHYDGYVGCKTLPELRQWILKKELE